MIKSKHKTSRISRDFVVQFANVNGSGSATANTIFAKMLLKQHCPIVIKNIFPSNIQGLPTWFEVRVSPKGYLGRSGNVDIMVAMNVNSFAQDMNKMAKGSYVIYDSSLYHSHKELPVDLHYYPVPVMNLATEAYATGRNRLLLQNLIYVGFLAKLLNLDLKSCIDVIDAYYDDNEKLRLSNSEAFNIGYSYAERNYPDQYLPFQVKSSKGVENKILVDGNNAAGLGAMCAGATVVGWYPITPSTSLIDSFKSYCYRFRKNPDGSNNFAIIQSEDEIAAIGIAIGANWNGCRAFTATSGPGVSLMSEFLGFAFYTEIPLVLFDVQRAGPSTGLPTRTQQSDLLLAAYASHGDTKHLLLFPKDPGECFDFALKAFDLADKYQTPVIVMSDLDIGMNPFLTEPFEYPKNFQLQRGKILNKKQLDELKRTYNRYEDVDGDGIPYRVLPATHPKKGAYLTRGSGHDFAAKYTEDHKKYSDNLKRIFKKIDHSIEDLPKAEISKVSPSNKYGIIYFGSSTEPVREALDQLKENNKPLNSMRLRGFPFGPEVKSFISQHENVIVIEQNATGQMRALLTSECPCDTTRLISLLFFDGLPMSSIEVLSRLDAVTLLAKNGNKKSSQASKPQKNSKKLNQKKLTMKKSKSKKPVNKKNAIQKPKKTASRPLAKRRKKS